MTTNTATAANTERSGEGEAFTTQSVSIAGAPTIIFQFAGETCRAELAGAKLYSEACADGATLRLTDAAGEVLAELVVQPRAHRNLTENVMDIGSALLWSHWRYQASQHADAPAAPITEEMNVHEKWYERRPKSPTELGAFVEHLLGDYKHDYGTIVHAAAAAALAAAHTVNKDERQGGLTGFQAGAVAFTFVAKWMRIEGPLRLLELRDMLFPQMADKFRTIPLSTFAWLQDEAKKLIAQGGTKLSEADEPIAPHPDVLAHWQRIADGEVPFGYRISD